MSNELVEVKKESVLAVFSEKDGLDPVIEQARELVGNFEHDLSTAAGRKRTASLANKVARLKTKLDDMGKGLTSEWKAKSKAVDQNRKAMRDALDVLKAEARKPLTEWEEEQKRVEAERKAAEEAEALKRQIESDHEIAILMNEKFDREMAEKQRIAEEQERLRIEREEQEKAKREEQIRIEVEERAKKEAEKAKQDALQMAENERMRAEQAERDRIAAEQRAKIEAEMAEKRRIADKERAEKEKAEAANKARQDEINRQKAEQEKLRKVQEAREANRRHVGAVRKSAKEALMNIGVDEEMAKKIIMAINSGSIPNVKITY